MQLKDVNLTADQVKDITKKYHGPGAAAAQPGSSPRSGPKTAPAARPGSSNAAFFQTASAAPRREAPFPPDRPRRASSGTYTA